MAANQSRSGSSGSRTGSRRGFAAMDAETQRRIAEKGGQASARSQERDADGQFAGHRGSGGGSRSQASSNRGGTSRGQRGSSR
jgi:general stress protein YciG